jgi:hypothetical protein
MKNDCFKKYKDIHLAERAFFIANGPSLAETDLNLIKDEISFGMNRVPLIYEKNEEWRPTYYVFSSTNVRNPVWGPAWLDSVHTAVDEEKTTAFIARQFKDIIDPYHKRPRINWFSSLSETKPVMSGDISSLCFSRNIISRIDKTGTTMNLALQLAYHMGITELIFVGADLGFTADRGSKNDPNHFDKSYRADIAPQKVYKINNQMRNIHSLALKNFRDRTPDIKFYNASKTTNLDVYPLIDYKSYIMYDKITLRDEDLRRSHQFWDKPPQYDSLTNWGV